jgi:hypothetical protein
MEYEILPNGNLKFTLTEDLRAEYAEKRAEEFGAADCDIIEIFAEELCGNCDLDNIRPEDVGALTDSPIIAEGVEYDPGGTIGRVGNVWWFPNYQVTDPAEVLVETGEVIFTAAPENK